jgi:2-phosphosulfolactate phosphatase
MNIRILQLIEGAKQARGLTVVIDVFRAFTMACYFTAGGASRIIPIGDLRLAFDLKKRFPGFILAGERHGKIIPGFAWGNSPTHIEHEDFTGKTIVQTTSAGTQGIANAKNADEIITGSFVNAGAVIRYIRAKNPAELSLVCMGNEAVTPAEEDTFFAEYVRDSLEGKTPDFPAMTGIIRNTSGSRFFDPANAASEPPRDFDLSLALNRFDFVLRAQAPVDIPGAAGIVELRKIQSEKTRRLSSPAILEFPSGA